jgi:hypothetical protein
MSRRLKEEKLTSDAQWISGSGQRVVVKGANVDGKKKKW